MDKVALQKYCLQTMGITLWQRRDAEIPKRSPLILLANTVLSPEEEELLARMLQALGWPIATKRVDLKAFHSLDPLPSKILAFGEPLDHTLKVNADIQLAVVPSLNVLLKDKEAKKRAWANMQVLVEK